MLSWVLCLSSIVFCLFSIVLVILFIFLVHGYFCFVYTQHSSLGYAIFTYDRLCFLCLHSQSCLHVCLSSLTGSSSHVLVLNSVFYFTSCFVALFLMLCFILVCLQVRFLLLERLLPCVIISAMKLLLCFMSGFPNPVFESNPVCHTMNWPSLIWNVYVENIIIFIILTLFILCRY